MLEDCDMNKNALYTMQSGGSMPKAENLAKIADYLGCSVDYLLGRTKTDESKLNILDVEFSYMAPIIGTVKAGFDGIEQEEFIGEEAVYNQKHKGCVWFVVRGDSMLPDMKEGDLLLVDKNAEIESGDIAVTIYNGEEGTVKKIKKEKDTIVLIPINSNYEPIIISGKDLNGLHFYGKVIESKRKY